MEQPFKFEENPYGYKSKQISAPKQCLIGFSGSSAGDILNEASLSELDITYKNKDVTASIWPEGLSKDVKTETIQQFEDAWFFQKKNPPPKSQGFIIQLGKLDENEFGGFFDSNFLFTVKIGNVERYMMLRIIEKENPIPDNIFAAVGKWIGSVANATVSDEDDDGKKAAIRSLCSVVAKEFSISDHKTLEKQHSYLADARWGSLKKFQSHKMDALKTTDPLGNTIAHLSIHNQFLDVFMHIAKSYPTLLNAQNMFGNTPLHHLALLHLRCHEYTLKYFDWKLIWELPWNYSTKNNQGLTAVEKLCVSSIKIENLVAAIQALIANERAWSEVKKNNDVAKLLMSVVIKYIAALKNRGRYHDENQDVKNVQYFLDHGASDKEAIFNAALESSTQHLVSFLAEHVKVSYESVMAGFKSKNREMADAVLKRFDLNTITKDQANPLCTFAVQAGWADIVSIFAKKDTYRVFKGCDLPLEIVQPTTKLSVANVIARVNSPVILPLKFLCADVIAASMQKEEFEKASKTWPEEIQALFHETDLWRWTLFLEDEVRRNRYMSLYSAISRAHRSENMEAMELCFGRVEISVKGVFHRTYHSDDWRTPRKVGLQIWPGKLTETPPETKYEILDYTQGDPRKSMKPRQICSEKNPQTLVQVLEYIGWPTDDDFMFLMICYSAFVSVQERETLDQRISKLTTGTCFFPNPVDAHIEPPKWFLDFLKDFYGIPNPKRYKKRKRIQEKRNFDSGSI